MRKIARPVFLFVALLSMDVSVLIMEKLSAGAVGEDFSDPVKSFIRLVQCPWVWGVVTFSLLQLFFWIKILRQTDLSVAYPISSLFFPLAMLASVLVFHEHVSWLAYTASLLIATGIFFVGSGEKPKAVPQIAERELVSSLGSAGK